MNEKLIKLLNAASKHSEYNQNVAKKELQIIDDNELTNDFYNILLNIYEYEIGNENIHNSWIAYYCGFTKKMPTGDYKVEERRTYARAGWPDIDMDYCCLRRHEIIEYLRKKYGVDHVAPIGTVQTLKIKAAVRRVIKVLDPCNVIQYNKQGKAIKTDKNENFVLENKILDTLPKNQKILKEDGTEVKTVEDAYHEFPEFQKYMDAYPDIYKYAKSIEKTISGFGVHAAGVVLSPEPTSTICPLHTTKGEESSEDAKRKTLLATQYTMNQVEAMGLIKFDVLALSTETALAQTIELIKENHGIDLNLSALPLDDAETLKLLGSGLTDGVFQCENYGMKEALRIIGIQSFNDLILTVAMYRPGPKEYISELASRKRKEIKIPYYHPIMKTITQDTYGIMIFQEQIMRVFIDLAGLSKSDGYRFLKGCAKKIPALVKKYKIAFIKGAINNGVKSDVAHKIWNDMNKFSGYAFNKAHAVSYALKGFKCAYLKAHYPVEFMISRLSIETRRKKFDTALRYEKDCVKNLGFTILDPDLNLSKVDWTVGGKGRVLRRPILTKGIGEKAAEEIVRHQPYEGSDVLLLFAYKTEHTVNKKTIEAMYDIGVWKFLGKSKNSIIEDFKVLRSDKKRNKGHINTDMFDD